MALLPPPARLGPASLPVMRKTEQMENCNDAETSRTGSEQFCLAAKRDESTTSAVRLEDCGDLTRLVAEIVVHKDELVVRLKSDHTGEASDCPDDRSLSIPWQKPPSKRSRQILLPHNSSRSDVRPEQFERRAR